MHIIKKILLIDDMKGIQDSLTMTLSLAGFQIDIAQNAAEGMALYQETPYDLVITDQLIPVLHHKNIRLKNKAPILAICASTQGTSLPEGTGLTSDKADAILQKPFSKEELLEKISHLLAA